MSGQPSLKQRKQSVAPKKLHRRRSASKEEAEAEWKVAAQPPPARRLTTPELGAARRMFFELDRDGSGSIESEELGIMLRSLGQNPTDDELTAVIASVDGKHGGDADVRKLAAEARTLVRPPVFGRGALGSSLVSGSDFYYLRGCGARRSGAPRSCARTQGKIQLREFLFLYSRGLDDKSAATDGDINDIFSSMGGDPRLTQRPPATAFSA
jgi:hypothetical protein